jgi:hypothetical protein
VNHAKFGTWLNPAPYQYQVQYDAARLARIGGKIEHLGNIPFGLSAYFGPARIQFSKNFPWLGLTSQPPAPGSTARIDFIEGYSSIPAAMPGLAILSILGLFSAAKGIPSGSRAMLPMTAAAFLAGSVILTIAFITYRYVHDFYPFLIVSAILGVGAVRSISRTPLRLAVKALVVLAGLWSMAANFAFALKWQREDLWPDPTARTAFLRMRDRMDSLFSSTAPEPVHYRVGDELPYFRKDQLLIVTDPHATYRYDGTRWNYVEGVPLHLFRLLVKFPLGEPVTRSPFWFAGREGASDAVYGIYASPTKIHFCSDHWGTGGPCGPATDFEPGREYHLRIDADRLNSILTVTLDDRQVLETPMRFFPWNDGDVLLGKSPVPSAHGKDFTGTIQPDPAR